MIIQIVEQRATDAPFLMATDIAVSVTALSENTHNLVFIVNKRIDDGLWKKAEIEFIRDTMTSEQIPDYLAVVALAMRVANILDTRYLPGV